MKKIISLLLCAVLLIGFVIPAFASEKDGYDGPPVVVVRGFDFLGLQYEDGSPALTFTFKNIFPGVMKLLLNMMICNKKGMVDTLVETANTLFSPIAADNNGNSIENIGVIQYPKSMAEYPDFYDTHDYENEEGILATAMDAVGAENCYYFTYDWRKSPRELASQLNTLIETAKADTKQDKVRLVSASMGTVAACAYMYYYGYDSVYNSIFLSGAMNGIYTIGDLFKGDVLFNGDILGSFLENAVSESNAIVKLLVKLVARTKILNAVCHSVNSLVDEYKSLIYDAALRNSFGLAMGIWSMCPEADFDACVEYMFGDCKDEYPLVMAELAEMRSFLFATEDIIDGAIERNIPVAFLSNYDQPMTPVTVRCAAQGDRVIEAYGTSFFATAAEFGKTLTDEQLAGVPEEFISPDRSINASTCRYPDCTWFIKDAAHVSCNYQTDYAQFVSWLMMSDSQKTVYDNALYPRFMLSGADQSLTPATAK